MQIGVPKERLVNETRVAATPKSVEQLIKLGFDVVVEKGAGEQASFEDTAYEQAGASIVDTDAAWQSGIIFKVNAPGVIEETGQDEVALLQAGTTLVSFIWPAQNEELLERLSAQNVNVMAM
ncbi:NAD(P) transhydrogenase subunit alpha, partial [Salinivibrio sp. IB282]